MTRSTGSLYNGKVGYVFCCSLCPCYALLCDKYRGPNVSLKECNERSDKDLQL